mmetsp:Transcript_2180/g.5554  ORF Transcript_2180/g.5554 Transcript_2180/m.5554 type:complete len:385 (+) Transcript_2180:389-1543(+)
MALAAPRLRGAVLLGSSLSRDPSRRGLAGRRRHRPADRRALGRIGQASDPLHGDRRRDVDLRRRFRRTSADPAGSHNGRSAVGWPARVPRPEQRRRHLGRRPAVARRAGPQRHLVDARDLGAAGCHRHCPRSTADRLQGGSRSRPSRRDPNLQDVPHGRADGRRPQARPHRHAPPDHALLRRRPSNRRRRPPGPYRTRPRHRRRPHQDPRDPLRHRRPRRRRRPHHPRRRRPRLRRQGQSCRCLTAALCSGRDPHHRSIRKHSACACRGAALLNRSGKQPQPHQEACCWGRRGVLLSSWVVRTSPGARSGPGSTGVARARRSWRTAWVRRRGNKPRPWRAGVVGGIVAGAVARGERPRDGVGASARTEVSARGNTRESPRRADV